MSQKSIADLLLPGDIGNLVNTITEYTDMIKRKLRKSIEKRLFKGKAIVLTGARQTGKTTLMHKILKGQKDVIHLNCDEPIVRETLTDANLPDLKRVLGQYKVVFIDEAQRVKKYWTYLKTDHRQYSGDSIDCDRVIIF